MFKDDLPTYEQAVKTDLGIPSRYSQNINTPYYGDVDSYFHNIPYRVRLYNYSTTLICPFCNNRIETKIKTKLRPEISYSTVMLCSLLFILTCGSCIMCLIPTDIYEYIHKCPNCNKEIGRYNGK